MKIGTTLVKIKHEQDTRWYFLTNSILYSTKIFHPFLFVLKMSDLYVHFTIFIVSCSHVCEQSRNSNETFSCYLFPHSSIFSMFLCFPIVKKPKYKISVYFLLLSLIKLISWFSIWKISRKNIQYVHIANESSILFSLVPSTNSYFFWITLHFLYIFYPSLWVLYAYVYRSW